MNVANKNILIDFNYTLCFDYFWRSAEASERAIIAEFLFKQNIKLVDDWMIGKYSSEDINRFLAEKLNIDYEYLWNIFIEDCKTMYIEPELIALIKKLRQKAKVFLVTDNMDCFDRFTVPALSLHEVFDGIYNSYNHQCLKSSGLFNVVKEIENIEFPHSLLIDDSKTVINIFTQLGGEVLSVSSSEDTFEILTRLANLFE